MSEPRASRIRTIPVARLVHGNEYWSAALAIDEMRVYCDLIDSNAAKLNELEPPFGNESVTIVFANAMLSSYVVEIGMKSLWALDHPDASVPKEHDLLVLFDGLAPETIAALERLGFTRATIGENPRPFLDNRYSMERDRSTFVVYPQSFLRDLMALCSDKLGESRQRALDPSAE